MCESVVSEGNFERQLWHYAAGVRNPIQIQRQHAVTTIVSQLPKVRFINFLRYRKMRW